MEWEKQGKVIALPLWIPCRGERLGGDEPGNHIKEETECVGLGGDGHRLKDSVGHGVGMGAKHPWEKSQGLDLCWVTQ